VPEEETSVAPRRGMDRRTMIKAAGIAGAAAWTAPAIIDSLVSPAAASSGKCKLYVYQGSASGNACGAFTLLDATTCADPTAVPCASCPCGGCANCNSGTTFVRADSADGAFTFSNCTANAAGTGTINFGTATAPGTCNVVGFKVVVGACAGAASVALTNGANSATVTLGSATGKNTNFFVYLLTSC
jgi:hypothetical protein